MSSPKVTYSYANGSANTIRPTSVTYPDNTGGTRVLTYDYGASGGMNDKLSRVESLGFGGTSNLVQPSYLGLGTPVRTNYTQPQVRWDLATGSTPNPYAGLDRFGRVIDNKWSNSSTSATLDQIKYTYDRASNRTTRENTVAKAQTTPKYFDELYGYDGSNRLTQMQRGQLAGTTSITNLQFAQDWGLDPTGNWQQFNEDSNGSGTNDLVQARTANPVNEITDITNSVGTPWVQPGYDAAGNMTTIPQGNEPEEGFTGVYDAWNRLVKLLDENDNVVAEYAYDGLTRRVTKTTDEVRHYYYNASWQILEERVGSATTYDWQYVWGLRYIDECVLRDKNGGARLYAIQDANWNVNAVTDANGSVIERFSYTAYGTPTFLNPDFTAKSSSDYDWDVLYAGYKWDSESAMDQVRYRYLLPIVGLWLTRDPICYRKGYNLYRYANNSGLNLFDPYGLAEKKLDIEKFEENVLGSISDKFIYSNEQIEVNVTLDADMTQQSPIVALNPQGKDAPYQPEFIGVLIQATDKFAGKDCCDGKGQRTWLSFKKRLRMNNIHKTVKPNPDKLDEWMIDRKEARPTHDPGEKAPVRGGDHIDFPGVLTTAYKSVDMSTMYAILLVCKSKTTNKVIETPFASFSIQTSIHYIMDRASDPMPNNVRIYPMASVHAKTHSGKDAVPDNWPAIYSLEAVKDM